MNYATGKTVAGCDVSMAMLNRLGTWTATERLTVAAPRAERDAWLRTLEALRSATIIEALEDGPDRNEHAMARWRGWNPAAGFFHQATKNVPFKRERDGAVATLTDQPYPSTRKEPEAETLELEPFDQNGDLARVLLERRTWRQFGNTEVSLRDVSTLLGLTWATQSWVHLDARKKVPLKTSPSGGARHSIEVYLLALSVDGLPPGTYRYCHDAHRLSVASTEDPAAKLPGFFPAQDWFHAPAAVFFMTSVFERVQWRYRFARAYRAILLEAGHFCQTFLLVATGLGLAPFCTAALGDSRIEDHLGIDGIDESVMYACGVGTRPSGVDWAPMPPGESRPRREPARFNKENHGQEPEKR